MDLLTDIENRQASDRADRDDAVRLLAQTMMCLRIAPLVAEREEKNR